MTDAQMISAILNAIQTDENVIILIRALITNNLPIVSDAQLQAMCVALGINPSS